MRWLWSVFTVGFANLSAAQATTCEELMAAHRIPQPKGHVASPRSGILDCSEAEIQMFIANQNAIADAQPITDLNQLHGTWLGDSELLSFFHYSGQEVLRIAPSANEDMISVEQF